MAAIKSGIKNYCSHFWSKEHAKKKFPIANWLPKYRMKHLAGDAIAGLTVGLTVIPQGLAYADVAGLPPQYGLYSAFMGCFIYAIFGTSKDVTLGPTAIMSLMTYEFSHLNPVEDDPTYAILLCFMCGVVQFAMGMLHLGFIVQFISYPVINGFTSAAAIIIATGQIKKWLGLAGVKGQWPEMMYNTFAKIPETKLEDFGMGLACMIILVLMKALKDFSDKQMKAKGAEMSTAQRVLNRAVWLVCTARNAVIVLITAGIAYGLTANGITGLTLTDNVKAGLPPFRFPDFALISNGTIVQTPDEVFSNIGAGIAVIPLVALLESIAIAKAFSRRNDYTIDANQELIAIGAANFVSCFVGSYPITGSFSRTAINSQSGVRTPLGGLWTGGLVMFALALLAPFFIYIPQAALAAVIITAVLQMVDYQILITLWRVKRIDLIPLLLTFIFCFPWGVEFGIGIGVVVNIFFLLYPQARPTISNTYEKESDYLPYHSETEEAKMAEVVVMEPDRGLSYPGIEYVKDKVLKMAMVEGGDNRSVVLNFVHICSIDYTTAAGLSDLCDYFKKRDLRLVFTNVQPDVMTVLKAANIQALITSESVDAGVRQAFGQYPIPDASAAPSSPPGDGGDPAPPYADPPLGAVQTAAGKVEGGECSYRSSAMSINGDPPSSDQGDGEGPSHALLA